MTKKSREMVSIFAGGGGAILFAYALAGDFMLWWGYLILALFGIGLTHGMLTKSAATERMADGD